uniref:Immunoglobulin V-set domain-containing protein n=1 Tax=Oryzias sinensis TaxID=183150 RepID=A0A8C7X0N0_9TELE
MFLLPVNSFRGTCDFQDSLHYLNGNVVQSSARASRLSVSSDCSLLITNITDEDAGRYLCQLRKKNEFDAYLHILSSEYSDFNHSVIT